MTHWLVYKTTDGGSVPFQYGLVKKVPIAQTSTTDKFVKDKDTIPGPLYNFLELTDSNEGSIPIDRDARPPSLRRIRSYKGSLVGLSRNSPRALYYSVAGLPESWPELFVITSFPLDEHDQLVDVREVGEYLIIAANGAMMRTQSPPFAFGITFARLLISPGIVP